jgi:hypothetical protein
MFVTCLFNRFLSEDLGHQHHTLHYTLHISPRIGVSIYKDDSMYRSVFVVDGTPILAEILIDNLPEYLLRTESDRNFYSFLLSYASALSELAR